ncbi:MAG: DUF2971 domain-containing protein [Spirochaetales bacterium]|nr:DUF2971 domain-containing protein [Spirochaetales bacterium]
MQDILRRELNTLFESLGLPGMPDTLSLEVKLDVQSETFFLKEEQKLFDELIRVRDRTGTFYHYTSFPALIEILKSRKIRFSSPAGLNDITEISSRNMNHEELDTVLDEARLKTITKRFIFSLTDRRDSLNQWRLYGADGKGVCLGLDLRNLPENKNMQFGRILYNETISSVLERIKFRIMDELEKNFSFRYYPRWGYFIKDNDYAEESEYRVVCFDDNEELLHRTDWRVNNYGVFYPYMDLNMGDLNINIESILFGPKMMEKSLNRGMVAGYLKRYYPGTEIRIETSTIRSYR